ncbi:MAG: hypothetical protein AAGC70_05975 [Pseudomonadota bacterium]
MLTRQEKHAIAQFLAYDQTHRRYWFDLSPYLVPPAAFAVYGLWAREFEALVIALGVLWFLAIW